MKYYLEHQAVRTHLPFLTCRYLCTADSMFIFLDDLNEDEIGKPILDTVLNPGDLLYFPRGVIHQVLVLWVCIMFSLHSFSQANALPDIHSLHITLSTAQRHTWGDLLERVSYCLNDVHTAAAFIRCCLLL